MIKMAKMAQIDQKMTEIWPKVVKMAQNTQKVERAQIWEKCIRPFLERIQIGKVYVFDKSRKWKPNFDKKLKIWLPKICQI